MEIPERFKVAPVPTDHLFQVAIPVPGRDDPILIEAPKSAWMTPEEVEAVQKWLGPIQEAEKTLWQWHADNDGLPEDDEKRTPYPTAAAELFGERDTEKSRLVIRESKIRFLKAHLSPADYKTLLTSKKIAERTIDFIVESATSPDITLGESGASTDS